MKDCTVNVYIFASIIFANLLKCTFLSVSKFVNFGRFGISKFFHFYTLKNVQRKNIYVYSNSKVWNKSKTISAFSWWLQYEGTLFTVKVDIFASFTEIKNPRKYAQREYLFSVAKEPQHSKICKYKY